MTKLASFGRGPCSAPQAAGGPGRRISPSGHQRAPAAGRRGRCAEDAAGLCAVPGQPGPVLQPRGPERPDAGSAPPPPPAPASAGRSLESSRHQTEFPLHVRPSAISVPFPEGKPLSTQSIPRASPATRLLRWVGSEWTRERPAGPGVADRVLPGAQHLTAHGACRPPGSSGGWRTSRAPELARGRAGA